MVEMQFFSRVWVQDFVQKKIQEKNETSDSNYTIYVLIGDFVIVGLS